MAYHNLDLFEVFKSKKASELEALVRRKVIQVNHFIRVVNAATYGVAGDLKCKSICRILPSDGDIGGTFSSLTKGTLASRKIAKFATRLNMQNRHNLHMFNLSEFPCWWAFTFTLNDLWAYGSEHWKKPHLHLTSWLSHPRKDSAWIVDKFLRNDRPEIPHDFHIRFEGNIGQDIRFG